MFSFGGATTEAPAAEDFPFASVGESFHSLLTRLKKVKSDESVKAVIMLVSGTSLGVSQIEEVRQVLEEIKASGKDVVAHADNISMRSYVLLSGASRICVVPTGDIWINGMYGESMHLRGLLDLVGVQPDFTTCGDYKSAAEMFMRKSPSPQAQENLDWLMDGIFETQLNLISAGRKVDVAKVREWIDRGVYSAERAKEAGIIDDVQFRQDFEADLKQKYGEGLVFDRKFGRKKALDIDLSSPFGILKFYGDLLTGPKKKPASKASVAIVYVEGPILPGASDPSGFPLSMGGVAYSTPIAKALDEAAADDSDQGRRVAGRFARRVGRGQRDHLERHASAWRPRSPSWYRWAMWRAAAGTTWLVAPRRSSPTRRRLPVRSASWLENWPRRNCGIASASTGRRFDAVRMPACWIRATCSRTNNVPCCRAGWTRCTTCSRAM